LKIFLIKGKSIILFIFCDYILSIAVGISALREVYHKAKVLPLATATDVAFAYHWRTTGILDSWRPVLN